MSDRLTTALSDRYRIERELGQGGMATVYLADDLKHNRKVALKVLKPELAAVVGAERFLAEIETTAQLQHPHILPLFDSGEADSFLYYVMPYVEGETLRDRLNRERQLPVVEAVALAGKVASALSYAHEKGVLHRDIKPANILLSRGEPLVADFGIALALGAAGGGRLTETGLSVGTPYYMSPEQATGDQYVGPPSDIYALGCVLYEMLVGDPPYSGSTAQAVLGKIISGEPVSPTKERPSIPANVDATIRRSLEKLPADRFADAADFGRALSDASFRHGATGARSGAAGTGAGFWKPVAVAASVVAVAALGLAALSSGGAEPGIRDVGLPHDAPMLVGRTIPAFAVAPDGSFMVYEANIGTGSQLWYRSLTGLDARPLRGTEGVLGTPIISPDGTRVAFTAGEALKVVELANEQVTVIGQANLATGGRWQDDGTIVLADDDGRVLRWFDPQSGLVREEDLWYCLNPVLLQEDTEVLCGGGSWKLAFSRTPGSSAPRVPWTRGTGTAVAGTVVRGAHFTIVDDRYLVYMSMDGTLVAAPILDLDAHTVGRSVSLVSDVRRESYTGFGQFALTADGTLVYGTGLNAEVGRLVRWTDDGAARPVNTDEAVHLRYRESPDGQRLASVVETVQNQELRVYDLRTGSFEVVEEGFWIGSPLWSPDGSSLVYAVVDDITTATLSVYLRRLNSPEPPRVLVSGIDGQPGSFARPDELLVGLGTTADYSLLIDPTAQPVQVDTLAMSAFFTGISPDGRWIVRQDPGRVGFFLQPWPEMDRRYTVSQTGAEPQWFPNGDLVYYDAFQEAGSPGAFGFWRVAVDPMSDPPFTEPELMFVDVRFSDTPGWSHAPDATGGLIYLQAPTENTVHYVRVIPGWVDEMKAAVDEANR